MNIFYNFFVQRHLFFNAFFHITVSVLMIHNLINLPHVFSADGNTILQKNLRLHQCQRVSFDGSGVVCVFNLKCILKCKQSVFWNGRPQRF